MALRNCIITFTRLVLLADSFVPNMAEESGALFLRCPGENRFSAMSYIDSSSVWLCTVLSEVSRDRDRS